MFEYIMFVIAALAFMLVIGLGIEYFYLSKRVKKAKEEFETELEKLKEAMKEKPRIQHMPTPDVVKMIDATLKDLVSIEVNLVKNQRVIVKDFTQIIAPKVQETYPFIDQTYIVKKTISYIESITTEAYEKEKAHKEKLSKQ